MSRFRLFLSILAVLSLTLPTLAQPPAPPKRVGKVLQIQGKTLKSQRKGGKKYKAYEGMVNHLFEELETDAQTQAIIEFFIGGQAAIKKGTKIQIVGDRKVETVGNKLLIKSGTVWAKVSKQQSKLQIETAGGTMGIEGTEFVVSVNEETGETELSVLEGAVAYTDNAGNNQMVEPGDQVVAGVKDALRYNRVGVSNLRAALRKEHPALAEASYYLGRFGYGTRIFGGRGGYAAYRIIQAIDDPTGAAFDVAADYTPGGLGGFVRRAKPKPAAPVSNLAVEQDAPPKFTWKKTKADHYMVLLARDAKGTDIVWYGKTKEDSIRYPKYGPSIEAGLHHLFVIPMSDKDKPLANKRHGYLGKSRSVVMKAFSPALEVVDKPLAKAGTTRPEFTWSKVKGAASYRVDMSPSNTFEEIVWSGKAMDATNLKYPAESRPLDEGEYFFRVSAYDENGYKMAESAPVGYASKGWSSDGLQASR